MEVFIIQETIMAFIYAIGGNIALWTIHFTYKAFKDVIKL